MRWSVTVKRSPALKSNHTDRLESLLDANYHAHGKLTRVPGKIKLSHFIRTTQRKFNERCRKFKGSNANHLHPCSHCDDLAINVQPLESREASRMAKTEDDGNVPYGFSKYKHQSHNQTETEGQLLSSFFNWLAQS